MEKKWVVLFLVVLSFFVGNKGYASVVMNEILADPASGIAGDANQDGITSSSADEFVELLNYGNTSVDVSGWLLKDAISTRHTFPLNTILSPYQFFVVFSGGNPQLPGVFWQKASTGSLSLNNTSETLTLFDNQSNMIDQVFYGTIGNQNQSIVRFPEKPGSAFVLHSLASNELYSPGKSLEGKAVLFDETHSVPEPSSAAMLTLGFIAPLIRKLANTSKKV